MKKITFEYLKILQDEQLKRRYDFAIEQLSNPKAKNKTLIEKEAQMIADERVDRQFQKRLQKKIFKNSLDMK